jgi:hypothetical protein
MILTLKSSFLDIFRFALSHFDKKITSEELALVLSLLRYSYFLVTYIYQTLVNIVAEKCSGVD